MLDDPATLTTYGPLGALILIIVREWMSMKKQSNDPSKIGEDVTKMVTAVQEKVEILAKQSDEMHKLHSVFDEDGVPKWYVKKSVENALVSIAECLSNQTEILRSIERRIPDGK